MNGCPAVDYDPAIWLQIPPFWGPETWPDHRAWARGMSEAVWKDSGERPREYEVENLALALAMCAERFAPDDEEGPFETFLHLPGPRADVLPVQLYIEQGAHEDPGDILRTDDPAVCDSALVEFPAPHLGPGLRHFFRQLLPEEERGDGLGDHVAVLRFAWELPEPEVTLVLTTSALDVDSIAAAEADIDNLARSISWVEIPEDI